MSKPIRFSLALLALACFAAALAAQEPAMTGPPKVLTIFREYIKPLKSADHEKTEAAFARAYTAAKWPQHYLAFESLSGKPRVLFVGPYESMEAWEKDVHAQQKNQSLSAALDRAARADSANLDSADAFVLRYLEEYSRPSKRDLSKARYWTLTRFYVKPGHEMEFLQIAKAYKAAAEKDVPEGNWAMYSAMYGGPSGSFVLFEHSESGAELDRQSAVEEKYMASMGGEGMKKIAELAAASIESSESNLFAVNPRMSYPPAEWVKSDPEFWTPKNAAPPAAAPPAASKDEEKKPAAKP
ncbi:MAG: hypothetical protein LAN71_13810 [Acidobacteriia bacterium]|nr:hypothetical protein [Terriglobia bacterium]